MPLGGAKLHLVDSAAEAAPVKKLFCRFGRCLGRHFDLTRREASPGPRPSPRPLAAAPAGGESQPAPAAPKEGAEVCRSSALTPAQIAWHYVALAAGVLAKFFVEFARGEGQFNWLSLVSSLIISAVVYPFVYKKVCDPSQNGILSYFVAFQSGFFFQTLLDEIQNTLT